MNAVPGVSKLLEGVPCAELSLSSTSSSPSLEPSSPSAAAAAPAAAVPAVPLALRRRCERTLAMGAGPSTAMRTDRRGLTWRKCRSRARSMVLRRTVSVGGRRFLCSNRCRKLFESRYAWSHTEAAEPAVCRENALGKVLRSHACGISARFQL